MGDVCHCPEPDFIERNGTWLLTVIGMLTGCIGGVLTYFLKSRCKHIKVGCMECDRQVVELEQIESVNMAAASASTQERT